MSKKDEVLQLIFKAAGRTLGCDAVNFTPQTNLKSDFQAKSINFVQIIGELEDEYEVEIDFMQFRNTSNLDESAEYVSSLI